MRNLVFAGMAVLAAVGLFVTGENSVGNDQEETWFVRTTVDFGIVVSDIEKSVAFYKDVLGLKELPGFDVPGDFSKRAGLTNGESVHIHVLVLGEGETATKVKLMQVEGSTPKTQDTSFINSTLGVSYLTFFVDDVDRVLKHAKEHGVAPIAEGPAALPKNLNPKISLAIVRDPDGNLLELVGPRG